MALEMVFLYLLFDLACETSEALENLRVELLSAVEERVPTVVGQRLKGIPVCIADCLDLVVAMDKEINVIEWMCRHNYFAEDIPDIVEGILR
jgi:hypothetical protein